MKDQTSSRANRPMALLLCLLLGLLGCSNDRTEPKRRQPNVLLITLDTLRADHLGCYGYARNTSPAIDVLASRATLFERAISQSAVTPVSHASILTGLNPFRHGLRSLHGGAGYALPEEALTLAEIFRDNGYATAGFVSAFPATRHYGLQQGFQSWDQSFDRSAAAPIGEDGMVETGRAQRRADDTTQSAIQWLDEQGSDPFLLWVHYFDTHDTRLLPPIAYRNRFPVRAEERRGKHKAAYDEEIGFVDDQVFKLLVAIERVQPENTIVVLIGDHGQGLFDHGWWGHSILYQEQIRIPLIIALPQQSTPARVSTQVRSIDLLPTLVELLGLQVPTGHDFDGESLVELLDGSEQPDRMAYSESINDLSAYVGSPIENESLYALQDGRWKLIAHREAGHFKSFELYDLEHDPRELEDLADEFPREVERLKGKLTSLHSFVEPVANGTMSETTRARLESLGYLQ